MPPFRISRTENGRKCPDPKGTKMSIWSEILQRFPTNCQAGFKQYFGMMQDSKISELGTLPSTDVK